MEQRIDRMARADEIADAVTERLAESAKTTRDTRRGRLNFWEKAVLTIAALAGIANVVLQYT
jgi:anti-sigma-K factor RskA